MYKNYIFDLYGTLIDIRTDEESNSVWEKYAEWLTEQGMQYTGKEVRDLYMLKVAELESQPSEFKVVEIDILPVFAEISYTGFPVRFSISSLETTVSKSVLFNKTTA